MKRTRESAKIETFEAANLPVTEKQTNLNCQSVIFTELEYDNRMWTYVKVTGGIGSHSLEFLIR